MKYRHLFFDLDHTLWDFESNSRLTLQELYSEFALQDRGVADFDQFHRNYLQHNDRLWSKYRNGTIRVDDLRWKRFSLTLLDFKIGDETLARKMAQIFLDSLPTRKILFPHTIEIMDYLRGKGYSLHLITNGFEQTQHSKLKNAGLDGYFNEVITSEGSNSLKPHKEIFDYALTKAKADALHSIMIGDDQEVDILGAQQAGIDQVFVNHVGAEVKFNPTYVVYSLNELKDIF